MFSRPCPVCGETLYHTKKGNCHTADKNKTPCRKCYFKNRDITGAKNPFYGKTHGDSAKKKIAEGDKSYSTTPEYRSKRSAMMVGSKNPMYGTSNFQVWVNKFGLDKAKELQEQTNEKLSAIFSGSGNPMFGKPPPSGSGNGWSGWYNGWYFRSLRELSYVINTLERNSLKWRSAESKDLAIPYKDYQGTDRRYFADFLVEEEKLVEIKPAKLKSSVQVRLKEEAAIEFCKERGLTYCIEEPQVLSDSEIMELYTSNKIKFLPRYEKMFLERFK